MRDGFSPEVRAKLRQIFEVLRGARRVLVTSEPYPDGDAFADESGKVSIAGDYLERSSPRAERSLWLLVEVEVAGETRFELLYGLDLNLAYARGSKYVWPVTWARYGPG